MKVLFCHNIPMYMSDILIIYILPAVETTLWLTYPDNLTTSWLACLDTDGRIKGETWLNRLGCLYLSKIYICTLYDRKRFPSPLQASDGNQYTPSYNGILMGECSIENRTEFLSQINGIALAVPRSQCR